MNSLLPVLFQPKPDTIYNFDALTLLRLLPDESVHCVVTSPPYFGLRDYGTDGQIGLEPTPAEYVAALVTVFRELRRVLRSDGTFWLNIGDSYAGSGKGGQSAMYSDKGHPEYINHGARYGFKAKDRMMIPARLAIALQDDGWYLRDEIVWHKPNAMPAGVTDRTTSVHEMVYLLTKKPRYWYDADAVAEPIAEATIGRLRRGRSDNHKNINGAPGQPPQSINKPRPNTNGQSHAVNAPSTRNLRSVWAISTEAFPASHFAVMPTKLVERCILAGCPEGGIVLDPFMGAGTVALVAQRLNRHFIGSDLNPEYVRMATMRVQGRLDEYLAEQRGEPHTAYMFAEEGGVA